MIGQEYATGIPIRDERLRAGLVETNSHRVDRVAASVAAEARQDGVHRINLTLHVELQGASQHLTAPVVVQTTGRKLGVTASEPVLMNAADVDLASGVGKLADIAKLLHMPTTVPVSFNLQLRK